MKTIEYGVFLKRGFQLMRQSHIFQVTLLGALLLLFASCRGSSSRRVPGDFTEAENNDRLGISIIRCAIPEVPAEKVKEIQNFLESKSIGRTSKRSRSVGSVQVPVIFHVISSGDSPEQGNIPDAMLSSQIQALNTSYVGGSATAFQFSVIGVTRTINPSWAQMDLGSQAELEAKSALRQGDASTLNIYIAAPPNGTLGWGTFPWDYSAAPALDGVVLAYNTLPGGGLPPYDLGVTGVHEVGHWLGLLHTFQDGCNATNDTIADTPPEERPSFGCPVGRDTCGSNQGPDAIHNYMNYSDDSCLSEFTPEQANRMDILASEFRNL